MRASIRLLLLSSCLAGAVLFPSRSAKASEGKARLIADLVTLEQQIEDTDWTWDNRDDKKAMEKQVDLYHQILWAVSEYESAVSGCGGTVVGSAQHGRGQGHALVVQVSREPSDTEVSLIERLVRVQDRLDHERFTFADHDLRKSLERERDRSRQTLAKLAIGLCGDDRSLTILRR